MKAHAWVAWWWLPIYSAPSLHFPPFHFIKNYCDSVIFLNLQIMTPELIVSTIAACLTTLGFVPQAIKAIQSRDTKSLSFWMYLLSFIGVIFWIIFGFMIGNYPVIIKNIVVMILSGLILYIKVGHILRDKEELRGSWLMKNRFFKKILGK